MTRPSDPTVLARQLRQALSTPSGEPAVLVISRYDGNVWWGGGRYGMYYDPVQRLGRLEPSDGYLFIRLNSDMMKASEIRYNDPVFWASKISHEILHTLGYWHPVYQDPADRERHNNGDKCAFMVMYEREIDRHLSEARGRK